MNRKAELLLYVMALVLAGLASYFTALGTLQQDVAVLKERDARLSQDVAELESDVKRLLQRAE